MKHFSLRLALICSLFASTLHQPVYAIGKTGIGIFSTLFGAIGGGVASFFLTRNHCEEKFEKERQQEEKKIKERLIKLYAAQELSKCLDNLVCEECDGQPGEHKCTCNELKKSSILRQKIIQEHFIQEHKPKDVKVFSEAA